MYDRDYFKKIEQLSQTKGDNNIFNAYMSCKYQLYALSIIKARYDKDVQDLLSLDTRHAEITKKIRTPNEPISRTERLVLYQYHAMMDQLRLDHETYIIFSRILMDKIAMTARLIAKGQNLPSSFSDQKKLFRKSEYKPQKIIQTYVQLLVHRTDWFEINLKFIRDKVIIHSFPRMNAYLVSRKRGVRVWAANVLGGSHTDAEKLISLKKKHEKQDSNLMSIPENMWEILYFFQNNDLKLDDSDIKEISEIILRNGTALVEVNYLESKLMNFLQEFENVF